MSFNATRVQFFEMFREEEPPEVFLHTSPGNKPSQPDLSSLSDADLAAFAEWRVGSLRYYAYYGGPTRDWMYNRLSGAAKAKADAWNVYEMAYRSWLVTDRLARLSQWAWARADAAISNYQTAPETATTNLIGTGAAPSPQVKQEP